MSDYKERGSWKFDNWICKVIDVVNELGCSFSWVPCLANQVIDWLAKQGAKHLSPLLETFFPIWGAIFLFFVPWFLICKVGGVFVGLDTCFLYKLFVHPRRIAYSSYVYPFKINANGCF